jgi:HEPN domain-containing protein
MKKEKQLLIDTHQVKFSIVESKDGTGRLVCRGEFSRADVPTANRRKYERYLWERELRRLENDIQDRKVFGELDHPGDGKTKLSRASHLITEAVLEEDGAIICKAEIMDTQQGKQLKAIIDAGGVVGVSSRGYGTTNKDEEGYDVVQEDYTLITWDFVADPANGASYPKFYQESKDGKQAEKRLVEDKMKTDKKITAEEVLQDKELVSAVCGKLVESHEEYVDSMKERFQREILTKIDSMREDIRKEVETEVMSKVMSDPKVAGAKEALEAIREILRPYVLPEDAEKEIANKESLIKELGTKVESKDKDINSLKVKIEELGKITKELGYKLHLERKISGVNGREKVIERIGNVSEYKNIDELNTKIDEVVGSIKTEENKIKTQTEEKDKQIEKLSGELKEAKVKLHETSQVAVKLGLKAILEKKLVNHPQAPKIRKLFREQDLRTVGEVMALVEQFDVARKIGSDYDKVRSRLERRQMKSSTIVEDAVKDAGSRERVLNESSDDGLDDEVGGPVSEVLSLAGIKEVK